MSALADGAGQLRFFAWLPDDALEIVGITDYATASSAGGSVSITARAVSVQKILVLMLLHQPKALFRVVRLWCRGNRKGAKSRFLQNVRRLIEPTYEKWLFAQRQARNSLYDPALRDRFRVLATIDDGDLNLIERTRASLDMLERSDTVEVSLSSLRKKIKAGDDSSSTLWLKLPAGTILERDAIDCLSREFAIDADVAAVYPDEGLLDNHGRPSRPRFQTNWNLAQSEDGLLVPSSAAIRLDHLDADLDLRLDTRKILIEIARRYGPVVKHSPNVLVHRMSQVGELGIIQNTTHLTQRLKVSVIIPTRDRGDMLKRCIGGLFQTADDIELEVIVIDNDSCEADTRALLDEYGRTLGVRRLDLPGEFNFARACNVGVSAAKNEFILLLNNDVEPLSGGWLRSLVDEAQPTPVGAVGALLLYPDGIVQHAGVTLSNHNVAYHTLQFYDPKDGEDAGMLGLRREVSAVTAACMLTKKSCWEEVGGMDETGLAVAFNDVDYCLKLRSRGKRIVWTPDAKLIHRESVSRKSARGPNQKWNFQQEERLMLERWHEQLKNDPFRSPNLSLLGEDFALETYPRF
jgi:GT2 family glycosyltransferase